MTETKTRYRIAVVHGDGIGPEVCRPTVDVIKAALGERQILDFVEYPGGAGEYLRSGEALPAATLEGCRQADAILHGAVGDPNVVHPDGTEAGPRRVRISALNSVLLWICMPISATLNCPPVSLPT